MACVLVIDDDPAMRRLLERWLCAQHEVTVAASATEAVQRVARGARFDVVLCEVSMPDLSGSDVHAVLQRIDPEQARRVVFLSGADSPPAGLPGRLLTKRVPLATLEGVIDGFLPIRMLRQTKPPERRPQTLKPVPQPLQDALLRVGNAGAEGDPASCAAVDVRRIEALRDARTTFAAWREGRLGTDQALAQLQAIAEAMRGC